MIRNAMQGRRAPWPDDAYPNEIVPTLERGDYTGPWRGLWIVCAPDGSVGTLTPAMHSVEEHPDGTISVQPSLDYSRTVYPVIQPSETPDNDEVTSGYDVMHVGDLIRGWHGWLKHGIWSEA